MANTDNPRGFIPVGHLNGSPYNGAGRWYYAVSTELIFKGDLVISDGTADSYGNPGITIAATDSGTFRGVALAFSGSRPGSAMTATNHELKYKTQANITCYVFVADVPDTIFEVQEDGTMAATAIGLNAEVVGHGSGDTTSGISAMELDSSVVSATAAECRMLGPVKRPSNTFATDNSDLLVVIANHELTSSTQILAGAK
ncbi:MAG: hypothetical protein GY841_16165 [FCB group bacterium]|nr:hypothetical protein [FCB group bacterium]